MIKPNELRIKNIAKNPRYFKEWGQHLYQTVECICGKDISTNKDDWDADYLEPVELTPDILEAAGFEKKADSSGVYFEYKKHRVYLLANVFEFEFTTHDDCRFNLFRSYRYLHTLQNLVHCLTGEELQIDITKLNKEK